MAVPRFNFTTNRNGWTGASLVQPIAAPSPSTQQALAAAGVSTPPASAPADPYAAFRTTKSNLADQSLGSRAFTNPNTGVRQVAAQGSVYGNPQLPAFLTQAVADLNSEQALRRSLQQEWNNKLFQQASAGGADSYLWLEALRAASVSPGADVNFGAAVQNPLIGQGYATAAQGAANQANATAKAISSVDNTAARIAALQAEKARLSPTGFGQYTGSRAAQIDNELQNLYAQQSAPRGSVSYPSFSLGTPY